MKYIVLQVIDHYPAGNLTREIPLIFPELLVHKDMADLLTRSLRRDLPDGRIREIKPVAAGFLSSVAIGSSAVDVCHGESETLKLASRPEDSQLIHMYDYEHGIVD